MATSSPRDTRASTTAAPTKTTRITPTTTRNSARPRSPRSTRPRPPAPAPARPTAAEGPAAHRAPVDPAVAADHRAPMDRDRRTGPARRTVRTQGRDPRTDRRPVSGRSATGPGGLAGPGPGAATGQGGGH